MRYLSVCIRAKGSVSLYHSINIRTFNNIDKSHIMKIKHRLRHQVYLSIISTKQTIFKTIKIFRSPDKPLYLLRHLYSLSQWLNWLHIAVLQPSYVWLTWDGDCLQSAPRVLKKKIHKCSKCLRKILLLFSPVKLWTVMLHFQGPPHSLNICQVKWLLLG